jgi:glutamate synthase (NADPH/NADH) small chain
MSVRDLLSPFTAWKNLFRERDTGQHQSCATRSIDRPGERYRGFHQNDIDKCIGCGTCEAICQNAAIDMVPVRRYRDQDGDSGCARASTMAAAAGARCAWTSA